MHAFQGPNEGHGDETLEELQEEEQFEDAGLTSNLFATNGSAPLGRETPAEPDAHEADSSLLEDDLIEALEEVIPGLRIVDRNLRPTNGRPGTPTADLVAVDENDQLWFCFFGEDGLDEVTLQVLDALTFVRENSSLIERHVGLEVGSSLLSPGVVVIVREDPAPLQKRMEPLLRDSVRVLQVCQMQSEAGASAYVLPSAPVPPREVLSDDPEALLHGATTEVRELVRILHARLERVDPSLRAERAGAGLCWSFNGEELCGLHLRAGFLRVSLPDRTSPIAVSNPEDFDPFIEAVLGRYVDLMSSTPRVVGAPRPLAASGELLSAEEIAAFQEAPLGAPAEPEPSSESA